MGSTDIVCTRLRFCDFVVHVNYLDKSERGYQKWVATKQYTKLKNHFSLTVKKQSWLFRGGDPDTGGDVFQIEFAYDMLKKSIVTAGQKAGITLPQNFQIVDINLLDLDNPKEGDDIRTATESTFLSLFFDSTISQFSPSFKGTIISKHIQLKESLCFGRF